MMVNRHNQIGASLFYVSHIFISVACSSEDGADGTVGSDAGVRDAGVRDIDAMGSTASDANDAGDADASGGPVVRTQVIETASGPVQGTVVEGVRRFMGIPYAASTAGANRWEPPQPVSAWIETFDALEAGPICPQINPVTRLYDSNGDEDCLSLNVWTPDPAPSNPLPVMVWLHGGGFAIGTGSDPFYDGGNLVHNGGVVVVTVNYRLGALGFLAHAGLSAADPDGVSGNYGLLDQRVALEWVQMNIAAFGGDRNNVTVFGNSAGGYSATLHLIMPGSQGLFHKAIVQSGNPMTPLTTLDAAEQMGDRFATAMGCSQQEAAEAEACLRAMDAQQIIEGPDDPPAQLPGGIFYQDRSTRISFMPLMDGKRVPDQPRALLSSAQAVTVPVLHGATTSEGTLFHTGVYQELPVENETQYLEALSRTFKDAAADIAAKYPVTNYPSANDALIQVTGDIVFVCSTRRLAILLARNGTTNYLYSFDRNTEDSIAASIYPELIGIAHHAAEVPYVFHNKGYYLGNIADEAAADTVMGYWTRFARTGDPNGDSAPIWPAFDPTDDELLSISDSIQAITGYKKDECDFWRGLLEAGKL